MLKRYDIIVLYTVICHIMEKYSEPRFVSMPVIKSKTKTPKPASMIVMSFAIVIAIGAFLLTLPISSAEGKFTSPLTAIFTAASATCVNGLIVVDTGSYWSTFGQVVILLMIQIGGIVFITMVSFFNFLIRKKM